LNQLKKNKKKTRRVTFSYRLIILSLTCFVLRPCLTKLSRNSIFHRQISPILSQLHPSLSESFFKDGSQEGGNVPCSGNFIYVDAWVPLQIYYLISLICYSKHISLKPMRISSPIAETRYMFLWFLIVTYPGLIDQEHLWSRC
jgi:hypothetical protein